jgi:hypothetical protein
MWLVAIWVVLGLALWLLSGHAYGDSTGTAGGVLTANL